MSAPVVAVLDYGSGNVHSAVRALESAGASVVLTREDETVDAAEGLLVPGVGAFAAVMDGLRSAGGDEMIRARHRAGRPLLGICVGMQVFFTAGTEHGHRTRGLGLWEGEVTRLEAGTVPHMGWTRVSAPADSRMFAGLDGEHFYFVHSYAATTAPAGARVVTAVHGHEFIAAVEDGATWAAQFHPEKSSAAGGALLRNWVATLDSDPAAPRQTAAETTSAHESKDKA